MTIGKIILSKEEAKAIEFQLKHGSDVAGLLDLHAEKRNRWVFPHNAPLNNLSQADLARALLIGYDVEPEYKVGECIKYRMGKSSYNYGKFVRKEEDKIWANWGESKSVTWVREKDVEKCTPEDIKSEKERQLWAKFGREVEEFKKGDVGMYDSGKVLRVNTDIDVKGAGIMYRNNELEGLYPAESFISFEEGEEE